MNSFHLKVEIHITLGSVRSFLPQLQKHPFVFWVFAVLIIMDQWKFAVTVFELLAFAEGPSFSFTYFSLPWVIVDKGQLRLSLLLVSGFPRSFTYPKFHLRGFTEVDQWANYDKFLVYNILREHPMWKRQEPRKSSVGIGSDGTVAVLCFFLFSSALWLRWIVCT